MTRWVSEVIIREPTVLECRGERLCAKTDSEMNLDDFDVYCPSSDIVYCFPLSFLVVFVTFPKPANDQQHVVAHLHIFVSLPIVYRIEMHGSFILTIDTLRFYI